LGRALCCFYEANLKLPIQTVSGYVRVRPDWMLMNRFNLIDALTRRLLIEGDKVWRTMGLEEAFRDGGPYGRYDVFLIVLEWNDEDVLKSLRDLGIQVEPKPQRHFPPQSFTSSAGFSPVEVRSRIASMPPLGRRDRRQE
jgi:hypothetical protein